uniref:Mitochondrial mRNA-processing protein COX24 C-terminal domain-containing protein n=1 Tax=Ciona savignyi TaxID=51511 RepID=H2ZG28_CIOSA
MMPFATIRNSIPRISGLFQCFARNNHSLQWTTNIHKPQSVLLTPCVPVQQKQKQKPRLKLFNNGYLCESSSIDKLLFERILPVPCHYNNVKHIGDQTRPADDFIEEPNAAQHIPLKAHKSDLRWRRRRMRRHRLLKWRNRYRHLVKQRLQQKLERRKALLDQDLKSSWEMHGLKKEPPVLTPKEKKRLVTSWEEEGIWTDALTKEEVEKFLRAQRIMYYTDRPDKLPKP